MSSGTPINTTIAPTTTKNPLQVHLRSELTSATTLWTAISVDLLRPDRAGSGADDRPPNPGRRRSGCLAALPVGYTTGAAVGFQSETPAGDSVPLRGDVVEAGILNEGEPLMMQAAG